MAKAKNNRKLKFHNQAVAGITKARKACENLAILYEYRNPLVSSRYEELALEMGDMLDFLSEIKREV